MREYMPSYNQRTDEWSVIAKDPEDEYWFTFLDELDRQRAFAVSEAMNLKEKSNGN